MCQELSATFLGLDIEHFERPDRDDCIRRGLRSCLYEAVFEATASISEECVSLLDRGDGLMAVFGSLVAPYRVLTEVIPILARKLDSHNRRATRATTMRLRVAVHSGTAMSDAWGYFGGDVKLAFRLLDSDDLRAALASAETSLVLAVSERAFGEVASGEGSDRAFMSKFRRIVIREKETEVMAWIAELGDPASRPRARRGDLTATSK